MPFKDGDEVYVCLLALKHNCDIESPRSFILKWFNEHKDIYQGTIIRIDKHYALLQNTKRYNIGGPGFCCWFHSCNIGRFKQEIFKEFE